MVLIKYSTPLPSGAQPDDSSILPANTAHVEIGIRTQRGAAGSFDKSHNTSHKSAYDNKPAGIHDTIVGFSGSTGGSSAAAANEAATTASAMIIVRGP